jgi:hypothetical protein
VTFVTIFVLVVAGAVFYCWLAGLPGRIAIARKHPEAEAVKLLGWADLLPTIYPWVQASPPLRIGLKSNIQTSRLQYMFNVGSSAPSSELRSATGEPRETGFRFHF